MTHRIAYNLFCLSYDAAHKNVYREFTTKIFFQVSDDVWDNPESGFQILASAIIMAPLPYVTTTSQHPINVQIVAWNGIWLVDINQYKSPIGWHALIVAGVQYVSGCDDSAGPLFRAADTRHSHQILPNYRTPCHSSHPEHSTLRVLQSNNPRPDLFYIFSKCRSSHGRGDLIQYH